MPPRIQSTQIREDGKGSATVELVIADDAVPSTDHAPHTAPQDASATDGYAEAVVLKMVVKADHPYLHGYQGDAIKRAITILEAERARLTEAAQKISRNY